MQDSFIDLLNLNGKIVVLFGGAGGLGQKLSLFFAKMGCDVVVVDLLPTDTFEKLGLNRSGRVSYFRCYELI